jgi:hypothetical protein
VELNSDTLPKYEGIYNQLEEQKILGAVEACLFEGGDGDLLGSIKVPFNDTSVVPSGEPGEKSIRDEVVKIIKGQVDQIFDPLAQAPPANQEMSAMGDLEKVLKLLSDVDAFYSYTHEASDSPPFASLTKFLKDNDAEAATDDTRISDAACSASPPTSACPALGIRLGLASLACDDYTIPPGSFAGQPTDPIPGLSYVLQSVNSYPRPSDGLTTTTSCTLLADNSSSIANTVPPKCNDNDDGLCKAMCEDAWTADAWKIPNCVAFCTGALATSDAYTLGIASAENGAIADGISSQEQNKYCPPLAAFKAVMYLVDMTNDKIFMCYDFDCAESDNWKCAKKVGPNPGGIDPDEFAIATKQRPCKKSELVASFNDAAGDLRFAIKDVETTATNLQPQIAGELKALMLEKLVDPFLLLIDAKTMDCSFMIEAFQKVLDGACYNLGGAIAQYASIFTLCAQCGFLLVFLMFFLWRHFLNLYDLARKEAEGGEKPEEKKEEPTDPVVPTDDPSRA